MIDNYQTAYHISGLHLGKVVKHLNDGKIKVYFPGINPPEFEDMPDKLPDCYQCTPLFAGTNKGNGMFSYPNIGTMVWAMFTNGDQNQPVAIGAMLGGGPAAEQYAEVRTNVTPQTIASGEDAFIHKINCGYSEIKMWESGRIEIATDGNLAGSTNAKILIDGKGTIVIQSTQAIRFEAPTISLAASSSIDMSAPTIMNIAGISHTTQSPSINLDAQTPGSGAGTVLIKGSNNSPLICT